MVDDSSGHSNRPAAVGRSNGRRLAANFTLQGIKPEFIALLQPFATLLSPGWRALRGFGAGSVLCTAHQSADAVTWPDAALKAQRGRYP